MDLRKLQRVVVDALEDVKAQDIRVYNTTGLSDLFDRVIIASGTSNRQTRALASHVGERVKTAGGHVVSTEGEDSGEWVLVDLGDVVVHIMQPAIRAYYALEELWGDKPVRVRLGAPAPGAAAHMALPAAGAGHTAGGAGSGTSGRIAGKRPAPRTRTTAAAPAAGHRAGRVAR